jgi:hypothetical protein
VSDNIIIQYTGFEAKALVREYTFSVREAASEPREFTLTIPNEAFDSHRMRYQDAPDICSRKLQRELAASANHPPTTHLCVTEAELDDYRVTHAPKSAPRYRSH